MIETLDPKTRQLANLLTKTEAGAQWTLRFFLSIEEAAERLDVQDRGAFRDDLLRIFRADLAASLSKITEIKIELNRINYDKLYAYCAEFVQPFLSSDE